MPAAQAAPRTQSNGRAQTIFRVGDRQGLAERRTYSIERQALTGDVEQADLPKNHKGADILTVTIDHRDSQRPAQAM
jgi:hypothetical protein